MGRIRMKETWWVPRFMHSTGVWPNQIPNADWILNSNWLTRRRLCKQISHVLGDIMWLGGESLGILHLEYISRPGVVN